MYNQVFDIDFKKLLRWMLPLRNRMPRMLAFINAFSKEIGSDYQKFRANRKANLYRLHITPQVCFLEQMLNDRYDYTKRRIYISDTVDKPVTYIYKAEELKPVYLGTKKIYTEGESGMMADDFIVFVPMDVAFEIAEMTSLVKVYKLAGTKFKIQRF